ncbi:hypothetical protein ACJX0J_006563, partial [Zea mays]
MQAVPELMAAYLFASSLKKGTLLATAVFSPEDGLYLIAMEEVQGHLQYSQAGDVDDKVSGLTALALHVQIIGFHKAEDSKVREEKALSMLLYTLVATKATHLNIWDMSQDR